MRLRFIGRTRFGAAVIDEFPETERGNIYTGSKNRQYFIVHISVDTRPETDLEELAGQATPVGLLAQRLLWLDEPEGHPQRDELVERARKKLRAQRLKPVWSRLDAADPDPVAWLWQAGLRALDQLLAQSSEKTDAS